MKQYKSEEELCTYLKEIKNVIDIDDNIDLIRNRSYVSSINPFKTIFATGTDNLGNHLYKNPVSAIAYKNLIGIDDRFGNKFATLIGKFERKLKIQIINRLCLQMVKMGDIYCNDYANVIYKLLNDLSSDFNATMPYGLIKLDEIYTKKGLVHSSTILTQRINLLLKLADHCNNKLVAKNSLIRHYQKKYSIVPFWLLAHILSFGELGILFNMLSKNDRYEITSEMSNKATIYNKDVLIFTNQIEQIRILRNIISHYEPIFPFYKNNRNSSIFELLLTYETKDLFDFSMDFNYEPYKNFYNKNIEIFIEFKTLLNKRQ